MLSTPPPIGWTTLLGSSNSDYVQALSYSYDNHIYAAGYTLGVFDGQRAYGNADVFLVKYTATGTKVWAKVFGSESNDQAFGIAQGLQNTIYVVGVTNGNLNGEMNYVRANTFVTKYSDVGQVIWTRLLSTSSINAATSSSAANDGSVYVAGYTYGSLDGQSYGGGTDAFLAKFGSDGTKLWSRLLGGAQDDRANGVTVARDGAIYVTGYSTGSIDGQIGKNGTDAFLAKYTPEGSKLWTVLLGSNNGEAAQAVVSTKDGSIYIVGYTFGSLDGQFNSGGRNAFVSKFNSSGEKIWTRLIGVDANLVFNPDTYGFGIAEVEGGGVVVTGFNQSNLDGQVAYGSSDIFLVKFDSNGLREWTRLFGTSRADQGYAITVNAENDIYIGGYSSMGFNGVGLNGERPLGDADGFILKLGDTSAVGFDPLVRVGTAQRDFFTNTSANERVNGLAGLDIVIYTGLSFEYSITTSTGVLTIRKGSSSEIDVLENIERVKFDNLALAFDFQGAAGQAYRLYKAAFNRDPMQGDLKGLGYWIAQLDSGMDIVEASARFVDSAEFKSIYGENPSNSEFLSKLYFNVLGRNPEPQGYNWWLNELTSNPTKTWSKVLADFSESSENQTGVLGLIGNGINYEPWGG